MKMTMKHGALALAFSGSATLFAGPTLANSLHDEGDFGGGQDELVLVAPSDTTTCAITFFRPYDERPFYGYGYGPAWSYDYYGPPIYYGHI